MSDTQKICPVIVVAAHRRVHSLRRLLSALNRAVYDSAPHLIISIDPSGAGEVEALAKAYRFDHGSVEVRIHPGRLGLKAHLLACGDLSLEYGSAIILEDDIYPAPFFYRYACEALRYYMDDRAVAGISLYAPSYNESAELGFSPLRFEHDVYFMQLPSSWGECFTAGQWRAFRNWLDSPEAAKRVAVPWNVEGWSQRSWKKQLLRYMLAERLFFVYPYEGLSTNFADPGTHHHRASTHLQTPLCLREHFRFLPRAGAPVIYDAFCELLPDCFRRLAPALQDYAFTTDLYGMKNLESVETDYLLTAKACSLAEQAFALSLKPHEMNVIAGIAGNDLRLCRKSACTPTLAWPTKDSVSYYYNIPALSMDNLYTVWKCDIPEAYFEDLLNQQKTRI
ncbi:hypothetical protein LJB81_01965 [Desulfovibrio sp. OttesenSCG-928-M14]|nr:hypothetical protein [Desulfovibrio sp. OttesenSCG-928-M14]